MADPKELLGTGYLKCEHMLRAELFGEGVDTRSGLVHGEGPRLTVAGYLNTMRDHVAAGVGTLRTYKRMHAVATELLVDHGQDGTPAERHERLEALRWVLSAGAQGKAGRLVPLAARRLEERVKG